MLVHVVGRGVERQQHLRTRSPRRLGGPALPDVGADVEAEAHTLHLEHAGVVSGLEVALLVEYFVVRQQALVIARNELAVAQHRRCVVALIAVLDRMAEDHGYVSGRRRDAIRLTAAGAVEVRP